MTQTSQENNTFVFSGSSEVYAVWVETILDGYGDFDVELEKTFDVKEKAMKYYHKLKSQYKQEERWRYVMFMYSNANSGKLQEKEIMQYMSQRGINESE